MSALATALAVVLGTLLPPKAITAWRTGAQGEERTGGRLDPLVQEDVILHDRESPGTRANIDHIAIGPPGVFVIETKNFAGRLGIADGDLRIKGRRLAAVDEVLREAAATHRALASYLVPRGLGVITVICVHRADLPWFRREVRKVRIVSGRGLVRHLRKSRPILSDEDVAALASLAAQNFAGPTITWPITSDDPHRRRNGTRGRPHPQ